MSSGRNAGARRRIEWIIAAHLAAIDDQARAGSVELRCWLVVAPPYHNREEGPGPASRADRSKSQ